MLLMIKSFGDKVAAQIWERRFSKRFPEALQQKAHRKLRFLDAATTLGDLAALQGNRLEKMKGSWKDYHSLRVNDQYRLWFRWDGAHAWDVHFGDYHDDL